MTDRDSKTLQLGLWRVPKPTDPPPPARASTGAGRPGGKKSAAAMVSLKSVSLAAADAAAAQAHPDYAVVFHRKDSPQAYPGYEAAGIPTLLPLGKQLANGGRVAERAVLERVAEALRPLRKEPGNPPPPSQVGAGPAGQQGEGRQAGRQAGRAVGVFELPVCVN